MAGETHSHFFPWNRRCDRARQWSSLRLDGELSDLEGALLDKHLETCPECSAFEANMHSTAGLLRSAPVEVPAGRFELPARGRARVPLSRVLGVAAVIAAAALGSLVGSTLHRPAPAPEQLAPQVSFLTRDLSQLRQLPRQQPVAPPAPGRNPCGPPEGIV
jgi:anti-sigma factor RsiW